MSARQYKNPPIEEAVCEFIFASSTPGQQFDLTVPGRLKMHRLMEEYSGEPRTQNIPIVSVNRTPTIEPYNSQLLTHISRQSLKSQ